jgi:leucine dehydrogenase
VTSATSRARAAVDRADRLDGGEHELLLVRRGRRTGAHTIVAVHSTVLGPSLGGCRLWRYPDLQSAIDDALRLSRAMTLKAAAAQLALGGGKAVVFPPADLDLTGRSRHALLHDFADTVNLLGGLYITAEDVGTTAADMAILSGYCPYVVGAPAGRGGSGDPGDFTAAGVQAAIRACCGRRFGSPDLRGRRIALVGLGHVGEPLARRLSAEGAELILSDIDPAKRALAAELGGAWADPEQALRAAVDVLAPCAMGGVLDEQLGAELRAAIVCGSANNQLAVPDVADLLAARGILYAPDFIVNSGGLINVALELTGYDRALALGRAAAIETVLDGILDRAERASITPLAAALALAGERIAQAEARDGGAGGRAAAAAPEPSPGRARGRRRARPTSGRTPRPGASRGRRGRSSPTA